MGNNLGVPQLKNGLKMFTYQVDYYSAFKNNDIIKFVDKMIKLKKIIPSKVTKTQKDKICMYSLKVDISGKIKHYHATIHRPREGSLQGGLR